jgi:hypothetical protein
MHRAHGIVVVAFVLSCAIGAGGAHAQLNTQHVKGIVGLKGGSQPPPEWYVIGPLIYAYQTDTVRDRNGDEVPIDASITAGLLGSGITRITTRKMFGGHYGFSVLLAGVNNRLQGTDIDLNSGGGFTDTAVQPIILGWSFDRADAIASYTVYVPTGRFTNRALDNLGFGMWGHEPAFGMTVHLNESRQYHAATVASFTFSSKKEDSETKVGTAMNLEGGVGRDFRHGRLTAGLVYYSSFKLTEDRIDGIPSISVFGKNKVFALGPEVSFPIQSNGAIYGFVKVNYQWEVYAKTTTQGSELTVLASFPFRAIKLPTP